MIGKLGAADGEEGAKKLGPTGPRYLPPSGSLRNPLPAALVAVLTVLIDDEPADPSWQRVELRNIRARLCRVFKLPLPSAPANASEIAWENEDGVPEEVP